MAPNDRLAQFKNHGRDLESNRLRRKENVIELRKARKEEQLSKRRNIHLESLDSDTDDADSNDPSSPVKNTAQIEQIVKGIFSNNLEEVLVHTRVARRILSKEQNPAINKFVELNAVPRLVELLKSDNEPILQFEAAWALTNIASGSTEQTGSVVNAGACPLFIRLLESPHNNVVEQAVWALANIAGDGPQYRDMLIQHNIVPAITRLVTPAASTTLLANVSWCLSNLCRHKNPRPSIEAVTGCLPTIKQLLMHEANHVVSDACWSLSYISDGTDDNIELVVDKSVLDRLVAIIQSSNERNLVVPAVRTLGNIVTGTDVQTQAVIDHGALPAFRHLLSNDVLNLRKEVMWALSNITAGNQQQIEAVVKAGLVPYIIEVLRNGDVKSQSEAVWAVSNLTCGGSVEQIGLLVSEGVLPPLVDMLKQHDAKIILVALEAIKNILHAGDKLKQREALCEALEEMGFADFLEQLQCHDNEKIYRMAVELVDEYWDGAENNEAANVEVTENGQEFAFSANWNGSGSADKQFQF